MNVDYYSCLGEGVHDGGLMVVYEQKCQNMKRCLFPKISSRELGVHISVCIYHTQRIFLNSLRRPPLGGKAARV